MALADAVSSTTRQFHIKNILIKIQQTTKLQFPSLSRVFSSLSNAHDCSLALRSNEKWENLKFECDAAMEEIKSRILFG